MVPVSMGASRESLPDLAVTGSTGQLGGLVARMLADAGLPQRLLVRDAGRAPDLPDAVPVMLAGGREDAFDGIRGRG